MSSITSNAGQSGADAVEETKASAPRFNEAGLIPVVAQDEETGAVLMVAWANQEALDQTLVTGEAHYWSRSRQKLWRKV